ncbi:proton-conducting transporter membrane subunit [Dyadobacter sp. BHUBP1]|uniref:proton-conducting transporter transmembrane domain-containing protein n=1 Tax=Dyadobacter sp. BHUBP1 TaxID=3424178 RepID=UPI003D34C15F
MTTFIIALLAVPLAGFLVCLAVPAKNERLISEVVQLTTFMQLVSSLAFVFLWIMSDNAVVTFNSAALFKSGHYEYSLNFLFDKITSVFLVTGTILTFLVTTYSRRYLHREQGYKRYFYTLLLFYVGYNTSILSGNFETLFIGWEILGITSFLLISFYRDRYLPVKNAVKVFSIYRLADVGVLLAVWASHHLWSSYMSFEKLSDYNLIDKQLHAHHQVGIVISILIILAASAKSAQLPFSSWLPRAMEGPTPSTAIFYGALSVHAGVYLLLRTYPFWQHQWEIRVMVGVIGILTSIVTTGIARVQSSVKSQIAYASISQIGLIFMEVSAGFQSLALLHFAGNAFLRATQLLVSPSAVSQLIALHERPKTRAIPGLERLVSDRVRTGLYVLCLKEWGLDFFMYRFLWNPFKRLGEKLRFLTARRTALFFAVLYLLGIFFCLNTALVPPPLMAWLPVAFSFTGLMMTVRSFTERKNVWRSWVLIIMNHLWVVLAISFNDTVPMVHIVLYLSGVIVGGLVGYWCLYRLRKSERYIGLGQFHGHIQRHGGIGITFLLASLGLAGFPITPTFVGEDLVFSHIHPNQILLALLVSLGCILNGIALIRIYARVFLGPNMRSQYELTYRSS